MPWLRLNDVGYDDPHVHAVGNSAYGALTRLKQYASAQRTDGWVPTLKARQIATRRELKALLDIRLGDGPPMIHRPGDECRCLEGKKWNADLGGYWVHAFLDENPSRAENDVHRAKTRELKDKELRAAVKNRDGMACRYCGITVKWADRKTPAGGVLDHVDPKIAAGADNLVVACRGCNGRKKDCTPEAAGLILLPPPNSAINAESTPDQPPITHRSPDRPETDPDPAQNPIPTGNQAPPAENATNTRPDPAQNQPQNPMITDGITGPMTTGTGRGRDGVAPQTGPTAYRDRIGDAGPNGHRPTVGPADTPRDQLAPNPYTRTATPPPPPQPPDIPR
ncbi:hypothetical protein SAMN04489729_4828 [Amycolatopsis lurida]|uniref:HNH endonuclease n=1 Tax=Amycolatopsis lurida TaxID=31959 RepID=UPI00089A2812|nr:HNH endonuclease signature motif containing protein [Amycolatopsis lurida]SED61021.1 hypothetical protein SAMN04489729_4828 [Amycolatopsis lurida]